MILNKIKLLFSKKNVCIYAILLLSLSIVYFLVDYGIYSLDSNYLLNLLLLSFLIFFSVVYFLQKIESDIVKKKILQEIPFFLNNLGTDLSRNIPLKIALEARCDKSEIGRRIKVALGLIKNHGFNLFEALDEVSNDMPELKRVFYQVQDMMEMGSKNREYALKTLADIIFEEQAQAMKRFSTKLNLFTLLFIVFSAIIPSMFLMFLLVGSSFLEINFSPITIIFITVILFPIIDMFLLLLIRSNNPV